MIFFFLLDFYIFPSIFWENTGRKLLSSSVRNEVDVFLNLKIFDMGTWTLVRCHHKGLVHVLEISSKWPETGHSGNICTWTAPVSLWAFQQSGCHCWFEEIIRHREKAKLLNHAEVSSSQGLPLCRFSSIRNYVLVFLLAKWTSVSCSVGKWGLRWRSEELWWICAALCDVNCSTKGNEKREETHRRGYEWF